MNNKQNGQPLCHALSRLSPNIFSHPVWVHFTETNAPFSPNLIKDLLHAAQQLQNKGDLNSACQILLICAVLQNRLGDNTAAINSTEQAWALAESHSMPHVARWAAWGASALRTRYGHYQQAAEYLKRLQIRLSEDNEWVLANVVEVLGQTVLSLAHVNASNGTGLSSSERRCNDVVERLLHWGEAPVAYSRPHYDITGSNLPENHRSNKVFSIQIWHSLWCTVKRIAKGELRLAWIESNGLSTSAPVPMSQPKTTSSSSSSVSSSSLSDATSLAPWAMSQENESSSVSLSSLAATSQTQVSSSPSAPLTSQTKGCLSLEIYCLGSFRVYQNNKLVKKWSGHKAKAIFKYLMTHRKHPTNREILIDLFWGEVDPVAARKNLHQAIYTLRQILQKGCPNFTYVLLEDGCYYLNPNLELWIDSEAFTEHFQIGQRYEREDRLPEAIVQYETAESLYQGEFLMEDRYEDWPIIQREELKHAHLDILDRLSRYYFGQNQLAMCITFCQKILTGDNCREDAHRRLIRCYLSQGQHHLALRQYHICIEALKQELDVPPMPATIELYEEIQKSRVQFSTS